MNYQSRMCTTNDVKAVTSRLVKQTNIVTRITAAIHHVNRNGHVSEKDARELYERLDGQLRTALDSTLTHIHRHAQQQTTALLIDLHAISRHTDSENESLADAELDDIQKRLAEIENSKAEVVFEPNTTISEYIKRCDTLGQLGPCDQGAQCATISRRPNLEPDERQETLNNLHSPFTRFDEQTGRSHVGIRSKAQEHSWNISLVSLAASSDTNNSRYNLSLPAELHREVFTDSPDNAAKTLPLPDCVTHAKMVAGTANGPDGHNCNVDCEFEFIEKFESCRHRTSCVIADIAIMADMSVVILDHYHNSIQLFAPDMTFLVEKTCEYPMSVCVVNTNTVAVSLRRECELMLFRVQHNTLKAVRKIKVPCKYYLWQVAFKIGRLFVVCDENNIHVMDTNGREYYTVCSGVSVERGFIRNFDVSDDGERLYLCEKSGLRCVTMTGEFKWLFSATDFPPEDRRSHGHVIEDVCYFRNSLLGTQWIASKVFQLSLEGHFLRYIVNSGLQHPRAMAIMNDRLLVTQFYPSMPASQKRQVKVFAIRDSMN